MNKTKRAFQLTCAIMSIVYGSLLLVGCLMMIFCLPMMMELFYSASGGTGTMIDEAMMSSLYAIVVMCLIFSVPFIAVGACACLDRSKRADRPSENTGLMVTLLVLHLIMLIGYLASLSILGILISLICVSFAIVSLCIRKQPQPAAAMAAPVAPITSTESIVMTTETGLKRNSVEAQNEKIAKICALRDQGVLTQEEAKKLIIRELQKYPPKYQGNSQKYTEK